MTNKTTKMFVGMLLLGVIMLSFASADCWVNFNKGQKENFCNPSQVKTCGSTICMVCISHYNATRGCFSSGNPWKCNTGGTCEGSIGPGIGNNTFDLAPAMMKILSPLNGTISKTTKLFLNFSLSETADVYYKDLSKNTNIWTKVCSNCNAGNPSYAKLRSFPEGQNNLLFKSVDNADNVNYTSVKFLIDSTAPRIYSTLPKVNSFADGDFQVQYKEANPKRLTLNYGTDKINLNLSKCYDGMAKKICDITVNLSKYEGKKIPYFFDIEDIAGNTYKSRPVNISIDTRAPVVNNPSKLLNVTGRYVDFNINITEPNFYKAVFIRTNSQTMTQTTICTRLVNGMCTKHQSFSKGNYSLSIQIIDKAGHAIAIPANFSIK